MSDTRHVPNDKPFNIRERLLVFACDIVNVAQKLHTRGPVAGSLSVQLVNAAVSAAANMEEADDPSGDRDFRAKARISLREIKEARMRLRVLRGTGFLDGADAALIQEAAELKKIVATIIRNNHRRSTEGA